jgi:hypothetical protein
VHGVGIVHRDLKPDNIFLVEREGKEIPKLLDFGIAKFTDDKQGVTRAGMTVGTPAYMAPEQITKGTQVGHSADIYALGMVLYEAVTGAPAFNGPTTASILRAHCLEPVTPPSQRTSVPIPAVLETVILRCLEKAPEHRFANAGEIVAALREGRPVELASVAAEAAERRAMSKKRAVQMFPALVMAVAAVVLHMWPKPPKVAAAPAPAPTPVEVARPAPPPPPVEVEPPPPPPKPATVTIRAVGKDGAMLYIGDDPKGKLPITLEIPKSDEPITLTAKFPDGKQAVQTVVPDRSIDQLVFTKPTSGVASKHTSAVKSQSQKTGSRHADQPKGNGNGDIMDPFSHH